MVSTYHFACCSSTLFSHCTIVGTQNGEMLYRNIGNGIPCRSATSARVSCSSRCQDCYECRGLVRFSCAVFWATTDSSTKVGETMLGFESIACVATGKTITSVRVCLISSVFLKRATSSLWNFALCVFSSRVDSSLLSNHTLSIMFALSCSFGSLFRRTPFSSKVRCAICIPKSKAVASSAVNCEFPWYLV